MAALVVIIDGQETKQELTEGQTLIGRQPDCAITISQPSVSGRHASIQGEGGEFALEDVGSRNGTFVNEQRIQGRVKLRHNDAIRFGNAVARFHDPAAERAEVAQSSSPTPVPVLQGTGDLSDGQVDIDEAGEATITDKMAMAGRFGGLDVNPEAKLKAVLEISNHLAGTVDLAALLPKILDSLFSIFRYADRGCILLKDEKTGELVPRACGIGARTRTARCGSVAPSSRKSWPKRPEFFRRTPPWMRRSAAVSRSPISTFAR